MTTVNHYQLYCNTEAAVKTVWDTTTPTVCPTDAGHSINTNSIVVLETVSTEEVIIKQPTDGYFTVETITIPIAATTPGNTVTYDYTFDDTILLWTTTFNAPSSLVGDNFDVIFDPDKVIGALTATGNVDDTVLNASSTVTANVTRGMHLTITDTTASPPTVQYLGKVKSVDAGAGTVTVQNALTDTFPPGSYILLNLYLGRNLVIDLEGYYSYTEKGFSGKIIPENTTLRMVYRNMDGNAKQVNWRVGFYYGSDIGA